MPTRDQIRAQLAFASVEAYTNPARRSAKADYKSLVLGLPSLIHECGLCQTVAFLQAKGKQHHHHLLDDLCSMLLGGHENGRHDRLGSEVRGAELQRYQQLTMEALKGAEYLKRYAEALLDEDNHQPQAANP